jgi:hypothetical protein
MFVSRPQRHRTLAGTLALTVLGALITVAGCSSAPEQQPATGATSPPASVATEPPAQSGPRLTATPNPLPGGPGFGTTTIAWSTGDGTGGKVYVVASGEPQKLFATGASGSMEAPWIGDKGAYEFRLYRDGNDSTPLATVSVRKQPQ